MNSLSEKLVIYSNKVAEAHFSGDIPIHYINHPNKALSIGWTIDADSSVPTLKKWLKTFSNKIKNHKKIIIRTERFLTEIE